MFDCYVFFQVYSRQPVPDLSHAKQHIPSSSSPPPMQSISPLPAHLGSCQGLGMHMALAGSGTASSLAIAASVTVSKVFVVALAVDVASVAITL